MIEQIVLFIEEVLVPLGALGVFAAAFIQEVIAPIPSTILLLGSGFVFLHSDPFGLSFLYKLIFTIVIPAALGMTLGSLVVYGLSYLIGKPAIDKLGKWFGVSWQDIENVEKKFEGSKLDEITLIALRAFPIIPNTATSALCGLLRVPVWKYLYLSAVGLAFRAAALALIGSQVGALYYRYGEYFNMAEGYLLNAFTVLAVAVLVILFFMRRGGKNNLSL